MVANIDLTLARSQHAKRPAEERSAKSEVGAARYLVGRHPRERRAGFWEVSRESGAIQTAIGLQPTLKIDKKLVYFQLYFSYRIFEESLL